MARGEGGGVLFQFRRTIRIRETLIVKPKIFLRSNKILCHTLRRKASQLKICNFFRRSFLKDFKCYNMLWVQRRHNCSPAASFANCVMTLYLLKVHLQTFLSIPVTPKCQISICKSVLLGVPYVSKKLLHFWRNVCIFQVTYPIRIIKWLYTGCFTTWEHYCRRWFPRSLWSKKFI